MRSVRNRLGRAIALVVMVSAFALPDMARGDITYNEWKEVQWSITSTVENIGISSTPVPMELPLTAQEYQYEWQLTGIQYSDTNSDAYYSIYLPNLVQQSNLFSYTVGGPGFGIQTDPSLPIGVYDEVLKVFSGGSVVEDQRYGTFRLTQSVNSSAEFVVSLNVSNFGTPFRGTTIVDGLRLSGRTRVMAVPVPEPTSLALLGAGSLLGGLFFWRRRAKR